MKPEFHPFVVLRIEIGGGFTKAALAPVYVVDAQIEPLPPPISI